MASALSPRVVLPIARALPLSEQEETLLAEALDAGARVFRGVATGRGGGMETLLPAFGLLYRRWVLGTLLVLRARGPLGFNELARALGGLAGESLAPKLQALEAAGVVTRVTLGGRPVRVRYAATALGRDLGEGTFALTCGKVQHARALRGGGMLPTPGDDAPADERAMDRAVEAYRGAVRSFTEARLRRGAEELDEAVATSLRFTEACVKKWHGAVLSTLALAGPLRFSELRAALGVGDQALSKALAELETLRAIERGGGAAYRVTPTGRYDLSLGVPPALLLGRSMRDERLHAA